MEMRSVLGTTALALLSLSVLTGCKRTLHETVIQEKIDERIRTAPVPPGFEPCVEFHSCGRGTVGCSKVEVEVLKVEGYAGAVRVRARKADSPGEPACEQEMQFEISEAEPPSGHRSRGSASMDPAYWRVDKLTRK
jgi:hypothetical protein